MGEFDKDFQTYTGSAWVYAFQNDEDPLTPNPELTADVMFPMKYTYRRINAQ